MGDDVKWITVNGTHIPIQKGETVKQAVDKLSISKDTWHKTLTKDESKAVERWTTGDYHDIRNLDKGKPIDDDEERLDYYKQTAANMDSALAKAPDVNAPDMYRGLRARTPESYAERTKVGGIITMPARSSFSTDKGVAAQFGDNEEGDMIYHVANPTIGKDITNASSIPEEHEIIAPKGTHYKITKVEPNYIFANRTATLVHLQEIK